ncbi:MAG: topoisomerase protein [Candidatus Nomurabacteria bacterium GW2011_GWC2_41_8]|uniref:DNA topoisomerase 1 n=3 Tax=Candidatus Nomuraibacteriota TaxID=1752729 RepID=A0A1F6YC97_9BACT|nr:MAG: topoisomerase protein [Candidatus Nomurabacteria bacterium GW2011_GWA2_41_25]KKS23524.1 MAG: topoisomerase protein [Candidatus Nomurabacteria bacterium GW2011_GWC2_41_8]OGI67563.1 MAG: DNA topoisomerase I [Candidatus Nomurabacteria bacterium RIFCSPHIGHO2_01_FULL_41_91]OGI80193.1 MAG: DNA topoisomerase I [Candidatus Nomurabacteria bacterium RIFCSPHIGHO2_02_FULL_41_52]OGI85257.1 MAG: DNA topoisomerase I [Candidatus Nomurabacteria bacterium RIFCSPHIGHO2_12_FULL_42_19]OGI94286.1 MAG: DNA t
MKLLIVESPSKAKTIEKYLEGEYTVRASVGHIRDLPKSNKKAIDIEAGFVPHYEISKGKEKIVHELRGLAEKAKEILLATDPDREGEAIAWHIETLLNEDKKIKAPIKRVTFHEITKEAVEEALKNPRKIDTALRKAQEARRVLDRLVGYDLSGLIWKKVRYGLSAGRVQSPALRIIMEREREIRAFIPEKFWRILGMFDTKRKEKITLECSEEPRNEKLVEKILELGKKGNWLVKDVKESEQKRSPRAPFTTSTLQQTASSRLGYSPSRTMQIAQKLYEAGHITYMRTDSTNLSTIAQSQIISFIKKEYGDNYAEAKIYKTKSKNAQEAHEAIRPTHIDKLHTGNNDQDRLYHLIWERAVSSQMSDAKLLKTKITAIVEGHSELPDFAATGSRLLFPGWLKVETGARGEDVELPKCSVGEKLKLLNLSSEEKFTEPPGRYSEAGLIKELEQRGIGRPSTYASIMRTIEERGYVNKNGKTLFPTDTGEVVSDFLEKHFTNYISDTFTAEMEDELDEISRGEREYEKTLKDFYLPFSKDVKSKEKLEKATNLGDAPENIKCPKCGSPMIIKLSRGGKFYSCSKYPECDGALMLDGTELKGPEETGEDCPECAAPAVALALAGGKRKKDMGGKLVIKERRDGTGTFISCSRYPKCKFIKKDEAEEARKRTGVVCPVCKKGDISERRGRFGIFYSCSNYPDCKFAIKAKPTGRTCEKCGSLMMEGTKTIPERCSNKVCLMHNPHKIPKIET